MHQIGKTLLLSMGIWLAVWFVIWTILKVWGLA